MGELFFKKQNILLIFVGIVYLMSEKLASRILFEVFPGKIDACLLGSYLINMWGGILNPFKLEGRLDYGVSI